MRRCRRWCTSTPRWARIANIVLWAIFAIAIVGIVAAIIQAYVVGKAGEIR